jgi:hypothetical protein
MKLQLSRPERIVHRIAIWSSLALFLITFIVFWLLHGNPELLSRWLYVSTYLTVVCVGLQLAAIVFVMRRSGIVPGYSGIHRRNVFIRLHCFPADVDAASGCSGVNRWWVLRGLDADPRSFSPDAALVP